LAEKVQLVNAQNCYMKFLTIVCVIMFLKFAADLLMAAKIISSHADELVANIF